MRNGVLIALALGALACASPGGDKNLYSMPSDLSRAQPPGAANPHSAAELAEGALSLLNPERPGGPDYAAAARICLLAAEAAVLPVERPLQRSCYRVAARAALRSGERDIYIQTVDRWERSAPRNEKAAGELALHLAIRDRASGRSGSSLRGPADLRALLPPPEPEQ